MLTQRMFERVVNQTVALAAAAEEAELKKGARRQGRQGGRRAPTSQRLQSAPRRSHTCAMSFAGARMMSRTRAVMRGECPPHAAAGALVSCACS